LPLAASTPIVCCVTDRRNIPGSAAEDPLSALRNCIRAAGEAGADWVQIREKDLSGRELLSVARNAVALARVRVIVNDRADVALAAGAAGVHLGAASAPLREMVRWVRESSAPVEFLVGISCHSAEEVCRAESGGAGYAFFGPVFHTPSKRAFGEPQGIPRLEAACRAARIPVIAIGGISEANAEDCIRAGASGIAAIRMFQDSKDAAGLAKAVARIHAIRRGG